MIRRALNEGWERDWARRLEALTIGELDVLEREMEAELFGPDAVDALAEWEGAARVALTPMPVCSGRPARGGLYVIDGGLAPGSAQPEES